jgi:hypothetical protein
MKHKIILTIAVVLGSVIVVLMSSDSTTNAQQRNQFRLDTGVITAGPGQKVRVSISGDGVDQDDVIQVRFRRLGYIEQDNLLRVASQSTTDPITLGPNEAASFDISREEFNGVRGIIMGNLIGTNAKNVRATVHIIDEATGEVQSLMALLLP